MLLLRTHARQRIPRNDLGLVAEGDTRKNARDMPFGKALPRNDRLRFDCSSFLLSILKRTCTT